MSYNDNDLMRRFQALRGTTPNSRSQVTSSSTQVLTHEQQQRPVSQPVLRPISQVEQQQVRIKFDS